MGEEGIEPLDKTTPINSTNIFLPLCIHELNAMLAKLTMECIIEEERAEDLLLQGIILIMLEDDYGIFVNRFINVILEVFNVFKKMISNIQNCLCCTVVSSKRRNCRISWHHKCTTNGLKSFKRSQTSGRIQILFKFE